MKHLDVKSSIVQWCHYSDGEKTTYARYEIAKYGKTSQLDKQGRSGIPMA